MRQVILFMMVGLGVATGPAIGSNALPASGPSVWPSFHAIDLTHALHETVPTWPGSPVFQRETLSRIKTDGYFLNRLCLSEHFGTHVDAPRHFAVDAPDAASVKAQNLVIPAVVVDIHERVRRNPDTVLTLDDIRQWEQKWGRIPTGSMVILATGWSDRWASQTEYRNMDANGVMHFPGFSAEAVRFLIEKRGIVALGIDTLSLDPGISEDFAVHHLLAQHGRYGVENLNHPERLPPRGALVVVGLLPFRKGSGSPARVLGLVPRKD